MKELGDYDKKLVNEIKKYDDSIHGIMKFESDTGSGLELSEFDLPIKFLSNMFNGKTSIDKILNNQESLELLIDL